MTLILGISNLLLPVIMLVAGRMMEKHCPKESNGLFGYRTKRSRRSGDTWRFAHEYCGKLWQKVGFILLIPTIMVSFPTVIRTIGCLPCILQAIVLLATILATESALKKNFTDDGRRK